MFAYAQFINIYHDVFSFSIMSHIECIWYDAQKKVRSKHCMFAYAQFIILLCMTELLTVTYL